MPFWHPLLNQNLQRGLASHNLLPMADRALLFDLFAFAVTHGAVLLNLLNKTWGKLHPLEHHSRPPTFVACHHVILGKCASPFALSAQLLFLNRHRVQLSVVDVLETHLQIHVHVLASCTVTLPTTKEHSERILHLSAPMLLCILELLQAFIAFHVIDLSLLLIGENFIRPANDKVLFLCFLRWVVIGMVLLCQYSVGFFDFGIRGLLPFS
mmetsp:Transcript_34836/g.58186  ORF Transcript_34836/g.58186 Transcript_34836/m.58186 type:complete len:211 (-) Transcript_34836:97-729(-)